jgi:hypothetical protein
MKEYGTSPDKWFDIPFECPWKEGFVLRQQLTLAPRPLQEWLWEIILAVA